MKEQETRQYKSPTRKLVRFFEKSRDQWKAKCKNAKGTVKRLQNRIRYLEKSKDEWKRKAIELEKALEQMKSQGNREPESERVKKTVK